MKSLWVDCSEGTEERNMDLLDLHPRDSSFRSAASPYLCGERGRVRASRRVGPGFTMVEVVVVCVVIAILASVAIPRFSNVSGRQAEASVQEFAELVSSAASRDLLTGQAVALDYDASTKRLRMYVPETGENANDARRMAENGWIPDPLSRGVELDGVTVVSATQDFAELDSSKWRVVFPRTEPRPRLVVTFKQDRGEGQWAVVLTATGTRARVVDPSEAAQDSDSVDLDAAGKSTSVW